MIYTVFIILYYLYVTVKAQALSGMAITYIHLALVQYESVDENNLDILVPIPFYI